MATVTVLGGCGAVGSVVVRTLAKEDTFDNVRIADLDGNRAAALGAELGAQAVTCDAMNPASIRQAIDGSDVVVNCVGPFYRSVLGILRTVIDAGIDYVDVCDDVDVTDDILALDGLAKERGVTALIGMGASPGITNLLARMAADRMLDETHSIDIFHAHGGEPVEGPGVIGHRFHCMTVDIPMYLDGELKYIKYFEPDGVALRQRFDFPVVGDVLLYPYPHPEQVTLPRYIPCRQVTNKGTVLPETYYDLTRDVCALGLQSRDPLRIGDTELTPWDFSTAFILRERERLLREADFGEQRGCVTVVVKGLMAGAPKEVRFHLASRSQGLGDGTGVPAAIGAILMGKGRVDGPGVAPPEGCVQPVHLLAQVPKVMPRSESGKGFGGLLVQEFDGEGNLTRESTL